MILKICTGIQLLVFIPYNFSWAINSTFNELIREFLNIRGSPIANFGAIFVAFGYTSSVYHLMLMGIERLYAISKPMSYRMQERQFVVVGIILMWILSIVACSVFGKYIRLFVFLIIYSFFCKFLCFYRIKFYVHLINKYTCNYIPYFFEEKLRFLLIFVTIFCGF